MQENQQGTNSAGCPDRRGTAAYPALPASSPDRAQPPAALQGSDSFRLPVSRPGVEARSVRPVIGGYRHEVRVLHLVFGSSWNPPEAYRMAYLNHPLVRKLLPFFGVELPSALRVALLGLAAGFAPRELSTLPGLVQPKRLRAALRGLEDMGRIIPTGAGYVCTPASPRFERDIENLMKRHAKLRRTLDMLADPMVRLEARALADVGSLLLPDERVTLLAGLQAADAMAAEDIAFRKRCRTPLLHFVARRVPAEQSRATPAGPRPPRAPGGLLARSQRLMPEHAERLERLYNALVPFGDAPLDHWWRILQACVDRGFSGELLWHEWRQRLEAYILRRRIPLSNGVRLIGVDARRLKATYPVPEEGYGIWVDHELELWRRFRSRFDAALGYLHTRALWTQAHEVVPDLLLRQHGGAHAAIVSEEQYEDCLFRAAEACSGLSDKVVDDLRAGGRRTAAVRCARSNAERDTLEMEIRAALKKAATLAADGRAMTSAKAEADRAWAADFLTAVARRATDAALDTAAFRALLEKAPGAGARGGLRLRRRQLSEQVRRELDSSFQLRPITIGPRESFPVRSVRARLRTVTNTILTAAVSDAERQAAICGLCDYVEHRDCIQIVYQDGTVECRSIRDSMALVGNDRAADRFTSKLLRRIRQAAGPTAIREAA